MFKPGRIVGNEEEAKAILARNRENYVRANESNREYWADAMDLVSSWRDFRELEEVRNGLDTLTNLENCHELIESRYYGNMTSFGNHLNYARRRMEIMLYVFDWVCSKCGMDGVSREWLQEHLNDNAACDALLKKMKWYRRYSKMPVRLGNLV